MIGDCIVHIVPGDQWQLQIRGIPFLILCTFPFACFLYADLHFPYALHPTFWLSAFLQTTSASALPNPLHELDPALQDNQSVPPPRHYHPPSISTEYNGCTAPAVSEPVPDTAPFPRPVPSIQYNSEKTALRLLLRSPEFESSFPRNPSFSDHKNKAGSSPALVSSLMSEMQTPLPKAQ